MHANARGSTRWYQKIQYNEMTFYNSFPKWHIKDENTLICLTPCDENMTKGPIHKLLHNFYEVVRSVLEVMHKVFRKLLNLSAILQNGVNNELIIGRNL